MVLVNEAFSGNTVSVGLPIAHGGPKTSKRNIFATGSEQKIDENTLGKTCFGDLYPAQSSCRRFRNIWWILGVFIMPGVTFLDVGDQTINFENPTLPEFSRNHRNSKMLHLDPRVTTGPNVVVQGLHFGQEKSNVFRKSQISVTREHLKIKVLIVRLWHSNVSAPSAL